MILHNILVPNGIMFHHFYSSSNEATLHPKGVGAISADDFREIINYVGVKNILPAKRWQKLALAGKLKSNQFCLTFDDGLKCQYDIAWKVLKEFNLTAFWFVYSAPLRGERVMLEIHRYFQTKCFNSVLEFYESFFEVLFSSSFKENVNEELAKADFDNFYPEATYYTLEDKKYRYVRDKILSRADFNSVMDKLFLKMNFDVSKAAQNLWMSKDELLDLHLSGNLIGLHSHSHPTNMSDLSKEEQRGEYRKNLDILSKDLGAKIETMAHPSGSYSNETLEVLSELGIKTGFIAGLASDTKSMLEIPRINHMSLYREINNEN